MERIISALEEMQKINNAYGISTEGIVGVQSEIADAKVCTPIIGKFSSGKSALINTALGYRERILREDITPETAIPAEIVYSDAEDSVTVFENDGGYKALSVDDYRHYEADANTVKCARIHLRNSFLKEIPDVMLVDMPGFESGFEIHNKAIDNYLSKSLAYIVAFPADDMVVRSSVGNILKELCLHDMPLCVVITKYDKKNDDFDTTFANLQKSLKRFIGDRKVKFCRTSSFTGYAEEFEVYLKEIQEQSQDILSKKYAVSVLALIENTENYLKTTINSSQLSESELDEEEERLKGQLSGLDTKFAKEQADFDLEVAECIEEIKNDIQCAMESETSAFVAMAMNNQSINDHFNNVVRNAVTVSVKKKFVPRIEKYLKRVANTIHIESIGDVHISFSFDATQLNKGITSTVVAVAAGILLGVPILGVVAGFFMKSRRDKKREEAKEQVRMKLQNEVYPQVLKEVGNGIEQAVTEQIKLVNTSIDAELKNQRETLEKALTDVRTRMNDEKVKKENLAIDIQSDLERLNDLKSILA